MKTPWPILSDDKYFMVEEASKLSIEAQDHQRALVDAPAGTPLVCELPSGPSLKIDPQTCKAVSFGLCFMLFYHIYDIDYVRNFTLLKLKISSIRGRLADGAHPTFVWI
jgi:hypothetical protein